jgi:Fic family protein
MDCMSDLERFIHDRKTYPVLIRAALAHVQFETIHPFLDGNGRLGRLLVTLFLCSQKVLQQPLLYLSLYFKANRADYYRLLQEVREKGAWEAWLEFFLDGVARTANEAFDAATRIHALMREHRERIGTQSDRASSALRVHEVLQTSPFLTASKAVRQTGLTKPTINAAFDRLQRLGIVEEITKKRRGRVYAYKAYLAILNEGGQPLDETGTMKAAAVSVRTNRKEGQRQKALGN